MALYYALAFICVIWNIKHVQSSYDDIPYDDFPHYGLPPLPPRPPPPPPPPPEYDGLTLPTYGAYLIGFTMLMMLIAIIILSILLYLAKTNKRLLPICENRKYVTQEATGLIICNATNNANNGSDLTMNSEVIEIEKFTEPQRKDLLKPDNAIKITFNKPSVKTHIIHRQQMDEICRQVLNRSNKTVSSSMRELNELQQEIDIKNSKDVKESKETKSVVNKASTIHMDEVDHVKKKEDHHIKNSVSKEIIKESKSMVELELYDTVPAPVRASEDSKECEYMPVYDDPPNQTHVVILDTDIDYLMPISYRSSTYVNAHTPYL